MKQAQLGAAENKDHVTTSRRVRELIDRETPEIERRINAAKFPAQKASTASD